MASLPPAQGSSDATDRSATSKVAIPRLEGRHGKKQEKPRQPKPRTSRTQRACDNCRKRKVRCTGEPVQCRNCIEQGATCVYSMARRDRFKEATQKNFKLVALLKDLSLHVDADGQKMIEKHLESLRDDGLDAAPTTTPETLGKRSRESTPSDAGSDASESDDDDDDADPVDEDFLQNRESRATGFVGSNSSVQWLRSLKTRMGSSGLGHPTSRSQYSGRSLQHDNNTRVSTSTFYLDDDDLDLDVMVDPYELPSPDTAERLFDNYMKTIHASFPILPDNFEDQFRKWNASRQLNRHYQVPEEWQAMLNLVLAIGAQYSHLTQADSIVDERKDVLYMTRACRILHLDKLATSLPAPSLIFIQALGLLSLYYLTVGQVSRAWMMVGISLRFALAAGLHLRNDDPTAMLNKKETLVRTWWSLHSIESLLCAIIGRPCIIPNDECTVPLPQIVPKKQSSDSKTSHSRDSTQSSLRGNSDVVTRSSILGARITIAIIMQKALTKLYSPQLATDAWDRIQFDITALLSEIDEWAISAHLAGLSPLSSIEGPGVERANLVLSFHYHSAKLLICRPCLCRIERHNKGQSDSSADFYQRTADMCVQSAQAMARLLPEQVDLQFLYEQCPWWSIVHHIIQAIAVFLLKLSLGSSHSEHDGEDLSGSVKKLTRWLHCMSASNNVAKRAYQVVLDIIRASAPRVHIDISGITSGNKDYNPGMATGSTSSRPSVSTQGGSASSIPTPASSTHYKQPQPQPQSKTIYPANLSPYTLAPPTSWSPQDPYTTGSTLVSPDMQYSTPPDPNTHYTPTQTEQSQHTLNQDLTQQTQPSSDDINMQFPAQQNLDNYQFQPDFSFDANMQMPSVFGNPFLTNFDQSDVLAGVFGGGSSNRSLSEELGMSMGMGGGFTQGMGGNFQR